jgi:hypothetical protein
VEDCNQQLFQNLRSDDTLSFVVPVGKLPTGTGNLPVLPIHRSPLLPPMNCYCASAQFLRILLSDSSNYCALGRFSQIEKGLIARKMRFAHLAHKLPKDNGIN